MDLFTYLMAKKGHNTSGDLFSYLLGKNAGGSGTYTTFSGISLNISNTLKARIKNLKLNPTEITQSGTPSSDSPVDVNITKGDNTITISNKNLFDVESAVLVQKGITSSTGTISGTNKARLENDNLIFLKAGTYTIKNQLVDNVWVWAYDLNKVYQFQKIMSSWYEGYSYTFTINEDLYVRFIWRNNDNSEIDINSDFKIQLEVGPTATEYVSPENQNYPINLNNLEYAKIGDYEDEFIRTTGKQLFDKDNANLVQLIKASGGDYFISTSGIKSFYIKVKPNTKYNVQKRLSSRFHIYLSEEKPDRNVAITTYTYRNTATSISITTGTNDNYLTVYFWQDSDTLTEQEILDTIMINEGEEPLPYEPYGVGELYLKENVGKVVLDGTETYTSVWNYPDVPRYGVAVNLANAVIPTAASQHIQLYSNRFVARTQEELWTAGAYSEGICIRTNNSQLIIKNNNITTATTGSQVVTDFKNWISNNNIKVAYPLATPKYTKISLTNYPILRNQLENIHNNATSYNGQTNITQTNDDLPFNISVDVKVKEEVQNG